MADPPLVPFFTSSVPLGAVDEAVDVRVDVCACVDGLFKVSLAVIAFRPPALSLSPTSDETESVT